MSTDRPTRDSMFLGRSHPLECVRDCLARCGISLFEQYVPPKEPLAVDNYCDLELTIGVDTCVCVPALCK